MPSKTQLTPEKINEQMAEEHFDPRTLDMNMQVEEVIRSFEGDVVNVKCKLYKIENGRRRWLYDAMPVEMSNVQNHLKTTYGPGIYENHVYINGTLDQRLKLDIGETLADKNPQLIKPAEPGLKSSDMVGLIREMQETNRENMRLMMEQFKESIVNAIPKPVAQQNPIDLQTSMMAMLVQMKEFLQPPQPRNENPISMVKDLMGIASEMQAMSGDAGTGPLLAKVAGDVLPSLINMAKVEQSAKNSNPSTVAQIPSATQVSNPATNDTNSQLDTKESPEMMQQIFVTKSVQMLLGKAQAGRHPEVYAEVLLDTAEEYGCLDWAVGFILSDTFLDEIYKVDPRVAEHKEWFEAVKSAVAMMTMEQTDENLTNTQSEGINSSNVAEFQTAEPIVGNPQWDAGDAGNTPSDVQDGQAIQNRSADS